MDDYGFDLDAALTMEDTSTEGVSEIERSDSDIQTKMNEFWMMMMPTVVSPTGVCTVCMEPLDVYDDGYEDGSGAKRALCGHTFHENCIRRWLSLHSSCPLCRSLLSGDPGIVLVEAQSL